MKNKIIIYIQDSDMFFTKGIKYSLLDYFHQKGSNVIFTDNVAGSPPIDFAFISAPLTKRACYCNTSPHTVHHDTRFFTIRERRHHSLSNLPHCELEYGTLYRQESGDAILQLMDSVMNKPFTGRRKQCRTCSGNRLTRREREVLSYLCTGASQSETAKYMHLSVKTVHAHKQAMMKKMDLRRKQDFIYWVLKNGHHCLSRID
ncbi:response regulator transcription factor [Serratia marcescens]|uniref:helix-turn-helix transcriptional regulator n=1 Tax=Serratia marcescens TaxID=615 RepID=UPI003FA78C5F